MLAIGIDLVEVDRWRRLLERRGQRVLVRVFASEELAGLGLVSHFSPTRPAAEGLTEASGGRWPGVMHGPRGEMLAGRLAGRWAAKEAVMKALGVKAGSWRDVVITVGAGGAPGVLLRRQWQQVAQAQDIAGWQVSISHERHLAVAVAVAVAWRRGPS